MYYTHISRFSDFTWEDMRTDMYFAEVAIKPRASQTLTKHSSNKLYTQPVFLILKLGFASAETRLGTFTFLRQILIMFLAWFPSTCLLARRNIKSEECGMVL